MLQSESTYKIKYRRMERYLGASVTKDEIHAEGVATQGTQVVCRWGIMT
jgi:hypothetical protein